MGTLMLMLQSMVGMATPVRELPSGTGGIRLLRLRPGLPLALRLLRQQLRLLRPLPQRARLRLCPIWLLAQI